MSQSFADFSLQAPIVEYLASKSFIQPSPVQAEALPVILEGRDVIVESPTGTGKTLAYLLPIANQLQKESKDIQALILAPTHELVMQIFREADALLDKLNMSAAALIGGVDVKRQLEKLKTNPTVVVATPGRLQELLDTRKIKIHNVTTLVVDEADRMLDKGFAQSVRAVSKRVMRDTQRLFFSATLPAQVRTELMEMCNNPVTIEAAPIGDKGSVFHFYLVSETRKKVDDLRRLIRLLEVPKTLVFVNRIDRVEEIMGKLRYNHLDCRLLHRESSKEERAKVLREYRDSLFPVLIVTDVAARGLDIPDVELVIHFDPATDVDTYIHRSGRTGRMGAEGYVASIIDHKELFILKKFMKTLGIPIVERVMSHGVLEEPKPRTERRIEQRNKSTTGSSKSRPAQGPRRKG